MQLVYFNMVVVRNIGKVGHVAIRIRGWVAVRGQDLKHDIELKLRGSKSG